MVYQFADVVDVLAHGVVEQGAVDGLSVEPLQRLGGAVLVRAGRAPMIRALVVRLRRRLLALGTYVSRARRTDRL